MIFGPQFIHISSSSGGGGGAGATVSYDSFAIPSGTNNTGWYVIEFNSKLYSYGVTDSEVHESSDGGATWSFKYHMQYNLNAGIIPVVESNRVLYIDGGSSSNVLKSWDGSSSTGTTISTGLTSGQINYFGKVDGYYYYSNFGGPLYRTSDTTLTSGWSQVSGVTTAREIVESGGTIVAVDPTYGIRRTANDWSTVSSPGSAGAPWSIATDGNGNWITGSQSTSLYSTDDGVTWATNYQMHSTESGTPYNNNNFILPNGIKFIGDKFFWMNPWDDELVSNANPFQSHYNNGNFTNTNSRVYQFPGEANYMSLVGNDKMFVSGQDANGTWGLYKFNITGIPASQTVTPASSQAILGYKTNGTSSNSINFQSNEHTTPAESKRLWSLGDNIISGLFGFYPDTANLEVGTVLYADSGLTQLAYSNMGWPTETRNTYAYYIINSNASNQYLQNPASVDYWVKVDTATSTILYIYTDAEITANTLKNHTSNIGTGGTIGPNGAFFFQNGAQSGYSTYADALNVNLSGQDNGYTIYTDAEDKYPKLGDRPYVSTSTSQTGMWGYSRSWHPFLLEGTTSSGSVQYAVKFDYASYDGSNIATTSPGPSNNLFITEIRDSNGNSVTQIT